MSEGLIKMWFSLGAMGFMFMAVIFILISRHRMKSKFLKGITAGVAYTLVIISGIVIFLVVFSGPVEQ
ncbi:hypothetical protein CON65_07825 [Bacillus pseudomycoides]|uniref:DUF2768 domain-containing protein n=1 Tax=Bacillus pseudomycoides TaxID=64104 RepID=A0AA91ZUV3_9BACI|nr:MULTISPECIES: DUF2768 domain-containing protein [Bacillus]PEB52632.1 hypothetical protein COO03_11105 [Bacillus sp. AFS098217]PED83093.1 hypothetical protein CON65_07825 [Bacillus pseudomycoides]PEU13946.1 hypothetical protein CN524_10235 [Bacillus sp. AFS019443]PEU18834.1 hypothetical protein CN525_09730 [Bacillus sp. AFS014408]PFW63704.1 hypothetical protein COL20_07815 [Bacillus sp. AFS075034]